MTARKRQTTPSLFDASPLPPWIKAETLAAFLEHRARIKAPIVGDYAQNLLLRKLLGMHERGLDVNAAIDESILMGYRGVFEPKPVAPPRQQTFREREQEQRGKRYAEMTGRGSAEIIDMEDAHARIRNG